MTSNERFFQQQRPAAVLKHGVLVRYATVFATMAGSTTHRAVYLDGYAGPGLYEDADGMQTAGSPVLLMRAANKVAQMGTSVGCFFVEQRPDYAHRLREVLARQAPQGWEYKVRQGDVADHVEEALTWASGDPLLAFLDPFGTALDFATITGRLLRRPRGTATELLLNFNLEMVSRIGGFLAKPAQTDGEAKTIGRLDKFLGGTWWHDEFRTARASSDDASAARAAQSVADTYRQRVHTLTGFQSFPVPIRRRPNHQPLFLLVLFYRHESAPWKFNESVSMANREWREACQEQELRERRESLAQQQAGLWSEEEDAALTAANRGAELQRILVGDEAEWVEQITMNLRRLLTTTASVPLAANIREVYGSTLGSARDKHVNKAWQALASEGVAGRRPSTTKHLHRAVIYRASGTGPDINQPRRRR